MQLLVVVTSELKDVDDDSNQRWVVLKILDEIEFNSHLWEDEEVLRMTDLFLPPQRFWQLRIINTVYCSVRCWKAQQDE